MKHLGNSAAGAVDSVIDLANLPSTAINAAGYWTGLSPNADAVPYFPTLAKSGWADENSPYYSGGYILGSGAQMLGTGGLASAGKLGAMGLKASLKTGAKAIGRRGLTGSLAPAADMTAGRGLTETLKTAAKEYGRGLSEHPIKRIADNGLSNAFYSPAEEQKQTGTAGLDNLSGDALTGSLFASFMPIRPGRGGGKSGAVKNYAGGFINHLKGGG